MRFRVGGLNDYWVGIWLTIIICGVSLWMAATGKLILYIHPRYIWFTVVMCGLGLVLTLGGLAVERHAPRVWQRVRWYSAAATVVLIVFGASLLLIQPATLTSTTATQRGVNTASLASEPENLPVVTGLSPEAYERFSLKEWSSLLAQVHDPTFFEGKIANVSGFVSPTEDNNPDVFYVSRFVVTCCAVDAQPIGVPVYMPKWKNIYAKDQWVQIRGPFKAAPEAGGPIVVVQPTSLEKIAQPGDPYAR